MHFGQLLTAMITPFSQDGSIDKEGTYSLIQHLANTGTDTLVVNGTTAESPVLTASERKDMLKLAIQATNKQMKVIAGVGSNNTAHTIELAKEAEALGADGIMVVTPYYNKPSQEGIYQHMLQVATAVSLPVMLYNVPGRTGADMSVDTAIRLSLIPNIVALKEASGDVDKVTEIVSQTTDHFQVYSGDDSLTLPMMAVGATGVVSVASHIVGREMKEMIYALHHGEFQRAKAIHQSIYPVMKGLFMAPNPTAVKAALTAFNLPAGSVRLPLIPLTDEEHHALHVLLQPFLPQTTLYAN
ncbi:4-hydroxy-tetrahydrodipicolinate synthase [Shouchella hunanensis]|uniref:4-hydroxy-tetrahydrodipicolinate synthase n=1 Tax=Shouchella hunanensis TaxID=766894 RepID=A0ABY7W7M1_9BACI|nr:4-hydroxy-tetrahydrodipicolinate synthase [Shouchella hunanensis]WDF03493.1 4-hydroxy-tetrahydrodipicolinate synthase [Shouchella hunanensis]